MRKFSRRKWLGASASALLSSSGLSACRLDPPAGKIAATSAKKPARAQPPQEASALLAGAEQDLASPSQARPPASKPQSPPASKPPPEPLKKVYLQPLGAPLSPGELRYIEEALHVFYRIALKTLPPLALPQFAYYPPRSRYRAQKLLDFLSEKAPADTHVIVGLTSVDISTTKGSYEDWGILGLATVDGRYCVVSRFRAKRGAKNAEHTRQRLAKTVVHEVGHTLGLPHCPHHGCLMEDGKGTVKTTDHEYDLCDECREKISNFVQPRATKSIPWPQP